MARMRYRTRNRIETALAAVGLVFAAPLLLALCAVITVAYGHYHWTAKLPLIGYWPAYWWWSIDIAMALVVGWLVTKARALF